MLGRVTSRQTLPSSPGTAEGGPESPGEDLAALLERLLALPQSGTQKDLAREAGISYPTLNAWMNRTRGTSRIPPEKLRAMVEVFRRWGVRTTPKEFFEAVGRPVPGPSRDEREARGHHDPGMRLRPALAVTTPHAPSPDGALKAQTWPKGSRTRP